MILQVWQLYSIYLLVLYLTFPPFSYVWMAFSKRFRQGTLLPRRAQSKKAPLSLRCRLYVSSGGGASRSRTITGIKLRTLSVIVWSRKSYTSGPEAWKGSARVRTESIWALSMAFDSVPVR